MLEGKQKNNQRNLILILIVVVLIIIASVIGIIYANGDGKLHKQLDLAKRYMMEMNYEQAIAAFDVAISIDSMNVEAYLGKAEAYIGLGDWEKAIDTLVAGYKETEDKKLKKEIEKVIDERVDELVEKGKYDKAIKLMEDVQDDIEDYLFEKRIEEIEALISIHADGTIVEETQDSDLPYVSIQSLVESATIEDRLWWEWTVDELSDYYGIDKYCYTENTGTECYTDADEVHYKKVFSDSYKTISTLAYFTLAQGGQVDADNCRLADTDSYLSYLQYISLDGYQLDDESVVAFTGVNGIVSVDSLIEYYGFDALGLTTDNPIHIDTEYGEVTVTYMKVRESGTLRMYFESEDMKDKLDMLLCGDDPQYCFIEYFNYYE